MSAGTDKKLVGFGMGIYDWKWHGGPPRSFDPGDLAWLSEEEFWCLKTLWPDYIYNLTPIREANRYVKGDQV